MDNSQTRKEGVSYTYKGYDGYAPIAAYLGREGWCLGCVLRPGSSMPTTGFSTPSNGFYFEPGHCKPILLRLDSAHDTRDNRDSLRQQEQIDFLIEWNPPKSG